MAALDAERAACVSEIKAIISAVKGGQQLGRLERDFRETIGNRIEYVKFGFTNLLSFLQSIPEVVLNGDTLTVYDPKMAHITAMVSKQRSVKKKPMRAPRYQTYKPSNYPSRYAVSKKTVYMPHKKMVPAEYRPAPRFISVPNVPTPAPTGHQLAPTGPERTRYGGMVLPMSHRNDRSSASTSYSYSLKRLEKQMSTAAVSEKKSDLSNKQKPKISDQEQDNLSHTQSYRLMQGDSSYQSTRSNVLEEQENVPRRENYQEQQSYLICPPKLQTSHTFGLKVQENLPSKYAHEMQWAKDTNVPPHLAMEDNNIRKESINTPQQMQSSSSFLESTMHVTEIASLPLPTAPTQNHGSVAPVNKTLKHTPFSVMDSNVKPLTPSERLQRVHLEPVHLEGTFQLSASRKSIITENQQQQRTVVVDQKLLKVQIENCSGGREVELEYNTHQNLGGYVQNSYVPRHSDEPLRQRMIGMSTPDEDLEAYYILLKPIYQNSQLIGDNFFLHMVMEMNEVNCIVESVDGKPFRCGLCISGLTIKDCLKQLLRCKVFREQVVLMVGAMDVMTGKTYSTMIIEMVRVIEYLFEQKVSSLVICTLPPILTANQKQRENLILFNEWIEQRAAGSKKMFCFNVFYKFLRKDRKLDETLFEKEPTSVDVGKVLKVHLWSQAGCSLVLHELNEFLRKLTV